MTVSAIKAGEAWVAVTAKNDQLKAGLKESESMLNKFRSSLDAWSVGVGAGLVLAFQGIKSTLSSFISGVVEAGDQLDKMSQRTGISVESLSRLGTIAELSGASLESLGVAIKSMNKSLSSGGTGDIANALSQLGLSIKTIQSLSPEKQFLAIAKALGELDNQSEKVALSMKLFGKAGTDLIPLFNEGADGIQAMSDRLDKLGIGMSTEAATASAKLDDEFTYLSKSVGTLKGQIVSGLLPAITKVTSTLSSCIGAVSGFVKENKVLVSGIVGTTTAAGICAGAIVALNLAFGRASVGAKALSVALATLKAHPIIAGLTAITALAGGLTAAFLAASSGAKELSDKAEKATQSLKEQQKTDTELFERLKQLNSQTSLTNDEMNEAESIVSKLSSRYDDLGLSINKATGEIEGMSEAQKKLTQQQQDALKTRLEAEIKEKQANRQLLFDQAGNLQQTGDSLWGNYVKYVGSGFKSEAQRQNEANALNAQADNLAAEIRQLELELDGLNQAIDSRDNEGGTTVPTINGRESSKNAESFNERLYNNIKDTSAEARKRELQAEADAILAPLIAERDAELTNAKRRADLNAQILSIEENLTKNIQKIDEEEKARLDAEEKARADAEKRAAEEEQRQLKALREGSISDLERQIAEAEFNGDTNEAERLKWEKLGSDVESASTAFENAEKRLDEAKESGDVQGLIDAQSEWRDAYRELSSARQARESAEQEFLAQAREYQDAMEQRYAELASIGMAGVERTGYSRGAFSGFESSAVANTTEVRIERYTAEMNRNLRDLLDVVRDIELDNLTATAVFSE